MIRDTIDQITEKLRVEISNTVYACPKCGKNSKQDKEWDHKVCSGCGHRWKPKKGDKLAAPEVQHPCPKCGKAGKYYVKQTVIVCSNSSCKHEWPKGDEPTP